MQTTAKILGAFLFLALGAGGAAAQDQYPSHTVKLIVPVPAGGITDIIARAIGKGLSQSWGQPVVIENRPGADQMLGTEAVAKSTPDGYTLLVVDSGVLTATPHLHSQMRYDSIGDLAPILSLGQVTPVMVVPAALPVNSVPDLIALAKAKPGTLNYGSFGNGTYAHLGMEDFKRRTGADLVHIPYPGAAPAITALIRNDVSVLIINKSSVDAYVKAGTLRVIAAAGATRPASQPELSTVAELGVSGFATGAWWGLFGPANLPRAVIEKIRADAARVLTTPDVQDFLQKFTMEPLDKTPEQITQLIRQDSAQTGALIKAIGLKPN